MYAHYRKKKRSLLYNIFIKIGKKYFYDSLRYEFPTEIKTFSPKKEICHCGGVIECIYGDSPHSKCDKCGKELWGGIGYNLYLLDIDNDNNMLYEYYSNDKHEGFKTEIKLGIPTTRKIIKKIK